MSAKTELIAKMIQGANERLNLPNPALAGNCGVFAIALSRVFPGGEFVLLEPKDQDGQVYHAAYCIDGNYFDLHGETTLAKIREYGDEATKIVRLDADEEFYSYIEDATSYAPGWDVIEAALRSSVNQQL